MSARYVSKDICGTIYPSGLCLVPARRPSISGTMREAVPT